jgi:hypothetical protein
MGAERDSVILYSPQAELVWDAVLNEGTAYSRREYIYKKYEESAGIFLAAYDAYIRGAEKLVTRPEPWAYPYWAFASMQQVDQSGGGRVMKLSVPVEQAVFFDAYDWYKVLRLSYIGDNEADEASFSQELQRRGIRDTSEVILKPFYPDLKRKVTDSWKKIFRHDDTIRKALINGEVQEIDGVRAIQAGLWQIKKEWLI